MLFNYIKDRKNDSDALENESYWGGKTKVHLLHCNPSPGFSCSTAFCYILNEKSLQNPYF